MKLNIYSSTLLLLFVTVNGQRYGQNYGSITNSWNDTPKPLSAYGGYDGYGGYGGDNTEEIGGYHFHTYYYQTNRASTLDMLAFREQVGKAIESGFLAGCFLNPIQPEPINEHPTGNFDTCCNATSINRALSWFMQNHGNRSVLLHPLTREPLADHGVRAMFLGPVVPLDLSRTPVYEPEPVRCPPVNPRPPPPVVIPTEPPPTPVYLPPTYNYLPSPSAQTYGKK